MKSERTRKKYRPSPLESKGNPEMERNFELAYKTALNGIANKWIHDEDSANNYSNTGHKERHEFGEIVLVYQPGKKEDEWWVDEGHLLFIIDKTQKVPAALRTKFMQIVKKCNDQLVADYRYALEQTGGKWFREVHEETAESILDITKPMECREPHFWKLSFNILDDIHGKGSWGWMPKSIQEDLGDFDETWFNEIIEKIRDYKKAFLM